MQISLKPPNKIKLQSLWQATKYVQGMSYSGVQVGFVQKTLLICNWTMCHELKQIHKCICTGEKVFNLKSSSTSIWLLIDTDWLQWGLNLWPFCYGIAHLITQPTCSPTQILHQHCFSCSVLTGQGYRNDDRRLGNQTRWTEWTFLVYFLQEATRETLLTTCTKLLLTGST